MKDQAKDGTEFLKKRMRELAAESAASYSGRKIFVPSGRTIISFLRPVTCRAPFSSIVPRSPVCKTPLSRTFSVSSGRLK